MTDPGQLKQRRPCQIHSLSLVKQWRCGHVRQFEQDIHHHALLQEGDDPQLDACRHERTSPSALEDTGVEVNEERSNEQNRLSLELNWHAGRSLIEQAADAGDE